MSFLEKKYIRLLSFTPINQHIILLITFFKIINFSSRAVKKKAFSPQDLFFFR